MDKQQIEKILDNAPEDMPQVHVSEQFGVVYLAGGGDVYNLSDLQTQLDQLSEIERLKSRELEAENIIDQMISEQANYCSDFGNLLPDAEQDSEVVRKGIDFMNGHVNELKELNK